jgi:hypothetical protein
VTVPAYVWHCTAVARMAPQQQAPQQQACTVCVHRVGARVPCTCTAWTHPHLSAALELSHTKTHAGTPTHTHARCVHAHVAAGARTCAYVWSTAPLMPKSLSFAAPASDMRMLAGLMSRWTWRAVVCGVACGACLGWAGARLRPGRVCKRRGGGLRCAGCSSPPPSPRARWRCRLSATWRQGGREAPAGAPCAWRA